MPWICSGSPHTPLPTKSLAGFENPAETPRTLASATAPCMAVARVLAVSLSQFAEPSESPNPRSLRQEPPLERSGG